MLPAPSELSTFTPHSLTAGATRADAEAVKAYIARHCAETV